MTKLTPDERRRLRERQPDLTESDLDEYETLTDMLSTPDAAAEMGPGLYVVRNARLNELLRRIYRGGRRH